MDITEKKEGITIIDNVVNLGEAMRTELENKIKERLSAIYSDAEKEEKALRLLEKTLDCHRERSQGRQDFTEKDSILITYGDSIVDGQTHGMKVLKDFMGSFVEDAIETIHLLPMYPYTSDDGFSVTDYREINPELGDWEDIRELSEDYGLMFDAVINHISRSSRWFQGYLRGEAPYTDYFITCDPKADYHTVTRPRALPLLTEVQTESGPKHVWTTFSEDQIDLNFQCPELLAEIVDLLLMYADRGARYIRLDAIGFMWKELGTSCMHLPQTHQIIKLFKDILHVYAPKVRIITETNVPHQDNISYFGDDGDEADLVYQFPLPPLVMFSLLTANAKVLSEWMRTLELPSEKVTYFNFLSSHDGIGVRPVEGLLKKEELQILVDATLRNGGEVSYKDNGDGTKSPYELNINYQDALAGPDRPDRERIGKFLAAETIFAAEKTRTQTEGTVMAAAGVYGQVTGQSVKGYEIHMGETFPAEAGSGLNGSQQAGAGQQPGNASRADHSISPAICLADGRMDGFVRADGLVFGSYLHGLFDNLEFTGAILTRLAEKKGISLTAKAQSMEEYKESQYDKLADLVRRSLDMEAVYKIMEEYEF